MWSWWVSLNDRKNGHVLVIFSREGVKELTKLDTKLGEKLGFLHMETQNLSLTGGMNILAHGWPLSPSKMRPKSTYLLANLQGPIKQQSKYTRYFAVEVESKTKFCVDSIFALQKKVRNRRKYSKCRIILKTTLPSASRVRSGSHLS